MFVFVPSFSSMQRVLLLSWKVLTHWVCYTHQLFSLFSSDLCWLHLSFAFSKTAILGPYVCRSTIYNFVACIHNALSVITFSNSNFNTFVLKSQDVNLLKRWNVLFQTNCIVNLLHLLNQIKQTLLRSKSCFTVSR